MILMEPSSQSFRPRTQTWLKLKLARQKLVAEILGKILLMVKI